MQIKTHYDPPPIPARNYDWYAICDETYGGDEGDPIGWGATEQEAIDDLLEKTKAKEMDDGAS